MDVVSFEKMSWLNWYELQKRRLLHESDILLRAATKPWYYYYYYYYYFYYYYYYYSFKIFPPFLLVKNTRIIHHKQLLLTTNSVILNQWRQKCSPLQIIEPFTSKWPQTCSPLPDYWIIDVTDYWSFDRENLGTRLCHSTKREMAASRVYKFERGKYFKWIIKELLNSASVGYVEFCRSRRVLTTSAFGLGG